MEGLALLRQAREAGLAVAQEGDTLVIRGPKRAEPIARLLIKNKPEVLAALGPTNCRSGHADTRTGKERAAITEEETGTPREWADGFARLDLDHPPGDLPLRHWRRFVDDVRRFLNSGWAEKASSLGWGPLDLFGCSSDKPFARIDRAGLLWFVDGNKLVAMSENTATIEMSTGARHIYRRKPTELGRVLAWELVGGCGDIGGILDAHS